MKQHKWRVSADVPAQTRALILRMFPPRFFNIHVSTITWAHGVESAYPFDPAVQDCALTGIHRAADTEAFVLRLGGDAFNGDRRLFLALSTDVNLGPVVAGDIDPDLIEPIDPIYFAAQLRLYPCFQRKPEFNPAFAASATAT